MRSFAQLNLQPVFPPGPSFAGSTEVDSEGGAYLSHVPYHSPETFVAATGRKYLYRALNPKQKAALGSAGNVPPDFFIAANNPDANVNPTRHVGSSAEGAGTQFISTGSMHGAAINTVKNWDAMNAGSRRLRPARWWGPIVEIDVSRLPSDTKLYDVGSDWARYSKRAQAADVYMQNNAAADQEVLIQGKIEASAISDVKREFSALLQMAQVTEQEYYERYPHERPGGESGDESDSSLEA